VASIIIDPVTRVEGHLKVEVQVNADSKVTSANVAGTLYRDFENILKGRHPWDPVQLTQRICGVCPVSHAIASAKAIEAAMGFKPSVQAVLLRDLIQGGNYLQDHILHFYHLNLMDYVAGPAMPPFTPDAGSDLRITVADRDRLLGHYVDALQIRRKAQEMVAVLGGKVPHVMTISPGGVTQSPSAAQLAQVKSYLAEIRAFISASYLPDVDFLASKYPEYSQIGKGPGNLLSYGVFDLPTGGMLLRRGRLTGSIAGTVDPAKIAEHVAYSYYSSASKRAPSAGATTPSYPKGSAYSWLKAPRYAGKVYETGPLARMKVNGSYAGGVSVMDRIKARALETKKIGDAMPGWLSKVVAGRASYTRLVPKASGTGLGLTEAPRGSLGHWTKYASTKITNYQIVTPTCWNASPRDDAGISGAIEQALVGTHVADPARPIEILRVIHSFDPCTGCAVHVVDAASGAEHTILTGPLA
jgi:hydrogenase large subunit